MTNTTRLNLSQLLLSGPLVAITNEAEKCSLCKERPAIWETPTGHRVCGDCRDSAPTLIFTDALLEETIGFLRRFIAYPMPGAAVAHALWIIHTHLMECWESTPRIAFLSPEPGSGKTRALEVTELLVPGPVMSISASPAGLFRRIADKELGLPTVLFDEIDTVFGPKARENENVRAVINSGHRRGATALRGVAHGRNISHEELPSFCAMALAGIGDLPDTVIQRSIVIRMRRRSATEKVEPFRRRVHAPEGKNLFGAIAEWSNRVREDLTDVWPPMPDEIADRDADKWEPLLAIADAMGGKWPTEARVTAVTFVTQSRDETPSLGIKLLTDLWTVFAGSEVMSSIDIIKELCDLEESPWADLKGNPITLRGLAWKLKPYDVSSKTVRIGAATAKGYTREDLWDAWSRYTPDLLDEPYSSPDTSVTSVTSVTGSSLPVELGELTSTRREDQDGSEPDFVCSVCHRIAEPGDEHFTEDGLPVCGTHR